LNEVPAGTPVQDAPGKPAQRPPPGCGAGGALGVVPARLVDELVEDGGAELVLLGGAESVVEEGSVSSLGAGSRLVFRAPQPARAEQPSSMAVAALTTRSALT